MHGQVTVFFVWLFAFAPTLLISIVAVLAAMLVKSDSDFSKLRWISGVAFCNVLWVLFWQLEIFDQNSAGARQNADYHLQVFRQTFSAVAFTSLPIILIEWSISIRDRRILNAREKLRLEKFKAPTSINSSDK